MNDSSKKRHLVGQVRRWRARFVQSVDAVLGDVLPTRSLMQWVRDECASYRRRIYDPLQTLTLFIEQVLSADHSCQDTVARGLSGRVALGQAPCSLNTAAYSKARSRLPLGLIERLGREMGELLCTQQPRAWRWRGREVKLVDGTTVSLPDTAANQASFPQSRTQKLGLGFPLARLVAIVSLSCGAVLDWAVKEIWVYLLAYNLIRLMMAQAALLADCLPRQLSFKHTLQLWIAWGHCRIGVDDATKIDGLFMLIAQQKVGDRPGRIEPRAIKRRPKPFPLLTVPRGLAREQIAKHGHPKKLK